MRHHITYTAFVCALSLSVVPTAVSCALEPLPVETDSGTVNGTLGGAGGAPGTGDCVCDPMPECSNPDDYALWCEAYGPGQYAALNCRGCGRDECTKQPGPVSACLGSVLWCCAHDFNHEPEPEPFQCVGNIMCEVAPGVFQVTCTFDEMVMAIDDVAAKQVLLKECLEKHPGLSCGLWTLECDPL